MNVDVDTSRIIEEINRALQDTENLYGEIEEKKDRLAELAENVSRATTDLESDIAYLNDLDSHISDLEVAINEAEDEGFYI